MLARVFGVLVLLGLAACAPHVEVPGPHTNEPGLSPDAFVMADGFRLPYRAVLPEDAPPKGVIVGVHGFNDYSNAFAEQSKEWASLGLATYAFDQRGFGESAGRGLWHGDDAMVDDLGTVVGLLRDAHPNIPVTIVGESMGGAVVLAALAQTPPIAVDRAVLSAPAVWGRAVMPWWQRWPLWFFSRTTPWLKLRPPRGLKIKPSDNIEMLRALGRDPLYIRETRVDAIHGLVGLMDRAYDGIPTLGPVVQKIPTLLLIGAKEDVLPGRTVTALLDRLPKDAPWRYARYESGYHMLTRDLNGAIVVKDIATFALDPTAPLPSGQERRLEDGW